MLWPISLTAIWSPSVPGSTQEIGQITLDLDRIGIIIVRSQNQLEFFKYKPQLLQGDLIERRIAKQIKKPSTYQTGFLKCTFAKKPVDLLQAHLNQARAWRRQVRIYTFETGHENLSRVTSDDPSEDWQWSGCH